MFCTLSSHPLTYSIAASWRTVRQSTVAWPYHRVLYTSFSPHINHDVIFVASHDKYKLPIEWDATSCTLNTCTLPFRRFALTYVIVHQYFFFCTTWCFYNVFVSNSGGLRASPVSSNTNLRSVRACYSRSLWLKLWRSADSVRFCHSLPVSGRHLMCPL